MIKISKYLIPYIIVILIIGFKKNTLIGLVIIGIHEIIHLITAKYLGFSGFTVDIFPIGTSLSIKDLDEASPKEDLIISLSGPLGNFFIAIICYILSGNLNSDILKSIAIYNMVIGGVNLIPAFPLDGGRILRDILCSRLIFKRANVITVNISIIIGYLFFVIFIFSFMMGKVNLDTLLFSALILWTSYKEKRRIAYIIMGYIIRKKEKLINRGYIENKSISVYYKLTLLQLIELVDKNKYNVFTVLNEDMDVIGLVYEEEILNAIKESGNITIEELLEENN